MQKIYIVTGASSGIGLAIANKLVENGDIVYSFSRSPAPNERIKHIVCDVTNAEQVKESFKQVCDTEGRIDCVVNNAGMGISGPAELINQTDSKKIIDVNFYGAITVASMCIPYLRESKGCLINISSLAGIFSIPFQAHYSATKAGILSFSKALRNEVKPLGVKVSCVLPCDTKTGFTKNRVKTETDENNLYSTRNKKSVERMEKDEQNGMSPEKVANVVVKISNKKNPPIQYTMGFGWKFLMFVKRFLPERLINYIIYQIYGK